MTYIKLLTVLAGLAFLVACGGSATPANNNTGGDTNAGGDNNTGDNSGGDNNGGDNSGGDNSGGNNNGGGGGNPTDCTQTPFHTDCLTNNAPALALRQSRCLANPAIDPSCVGIITTYCTTNPTEAPCVVNTADWTGSFTGGEALPTTPNATRKNEFLQATTTGFNTGANAGIRAIFGSPTTDIAIETLTFSSADTATGGVAFFGGAVYANNARVGTAGFYYAGILAGTDLGAPITETITSAKWKGQISSASNDASAQLDAGEVTDFELNITFDGTKGTIEKTFAANLTLAYSIDGKFDANGIITGSVDFGAGDADGINTGHPTYAPGTLRGIIGQNGAVGVFHSDNANPEAGVAAASFAGGFIARPPVPDPEPLVVNYGDWTHDFIPSLPATPDTAPRRNQFLQGTPADAPSNAGLNAGVGYSVDAGLSQPTAFIVDFENGFPRELITGIGGDAADGFAFFNGTVGDDRYYYVSILPTTNLGAPITTATGTADWPGRAVIQLGGFSSPYPNFVLTVDFGKSEVSSPASGNLGFSLKGTWDERGVITGTTLNAFYLDDVRTMLDVGHAFNAPGILTGLIGQDGAVGVFYSNNDGIGTSTYSGGFIAAPPDDN